MTENGKVAIIVLNWNGWKDTIECLASILDSGHNRFQIILVDNGSEDGSIDKIKQWAESKLPVRVGPKENEAKYYQTDYAIVEDDFLEQREKELTLDPPLVIIKSARNRGFAGGCNLGIEVALKSSVEYIFLLNNDTALEKDALPGLTHFMSDHSIYDVVTPKICYYAPSDTIWNCGGKLTWTGSRKYYFANKKMSEKNASGHRKISFITGCALFARASVFRRYGLLTEKFFFGEEDYEFSLRMKKNSVPVGVLYSSTVYHKISATSKTVYDDQLAHAFIGMINRYVNMKDHYSFFYWNMWRYLSALYIGPMLIVKRKVNIKQALIFVKKLIRDSGKKQEIDQKYLMEIKHFFMNV